jgi:hypothetical protein
MPLHHPGSPRRARDDHSSRKASRRNTLTLCPGS